MKQYLTPHDVANQVRMMRPLFKGAVLLVEGDSDAHVYKRFVREKDCRVVPAHGKSNVLGAMEILEGALIRGVLAIVDSDYWRLEGKEPDSENVLLTDTHDLETMIVSSRALDTVLGEFGSPPKIRRLGGDVRKLLLKAARPIGFVRWISSSDQENLSLRFRSISFVEVMDTRSGSMRTDVDALIRELKKDSHAVSLDEDELKSTLRGLMRSKKYDPWQVCRGHDMVHILAIGLREVFGNRHARSMSYEQVDRVLRVAFGYAEFSETMLFASIELWERRNPPFRVLL